MNMNKHKTLRRAALIVSLIPGALLVAGSFAGSFYHHFSYYSSFFFFGLLFLLIAGAAWKAPLFGGLLFLLLSIGAFVWLSLPGATYDLNTAFLYGAILPFSVVVFICGILNLVVWWKGRETKTDPIR